MNAFGYPHQANGSGDKWDLTMAETLTDDLQQFYAG
jgi:hypothetical protein